MTTTDIVAVLSEVLAAVAPDADLRSVPRGAVLREELDLDSMDLLAVYAGLCKRLAIEIPEADYPQLATLDGLVAYVSRKLG